MVIQNVVTEGHAELQNGITYGIEVIDRQRALEYLSKNKDNRHVSPSWVRDLANRQKRGEWMFTGDPIRFDWDGWLRDGQHRLRMVEQTGKSIQVLVVRGLDPKCFMVLDSGKKRGLDTVLEINNYPHFKALSTIAPAVWSYLANLTTTGVSNQMYVDFLKDHKDISEAVNFYQGRKKDDGVSLIGYPEPLTVAYYLLCQIDPSEGQEFITKIMYGNDTSGIRLTLRNTLAKWWGTVPRTSRPPYRAALYVIIQSWNQFKAGKETKDQIRTPTAEKLRSPRTIIPEPFPRTLFFTPPRQLALGEMEESEEREAADNGEESP
jgi:hypothetical protein